MSEIVIDVVLELPTGVCELALSASALMAGRMESAAHPSAFQLGFPFPGSGDAEACAPHVSLFMLRVDEPEIDEILAATAAVAERTPAVAATGRWWRHNPFGAPELHFAPSAGWTALQRAVVGAIEPIRRGRLRDTDPSGDHLAAAVDRLRRDEPRSPRLRQLLAYGYDEIVDDDDDRFNPHITVAWPADNEFLIELAGLPHPHEFDCLLADLAVYAMRPHGTCTRRYGGSQLKPIVDGFEKPE